MPDRERLPIGIGSLHLVRLRVDARERSVIPVRRPTQRPRLTAIVPSDLRPTGIASTTPPSSGSIRETESACGVRHPDRSGPPAIPVGRLPNADGSSSGPPGTRPGCSASRLGLAVVGDPNGAAAHYDAGRIQRPRVSSPHVPGIRFDARQRPSRRRQPRPSPRRSSHCAIRRSRQGRRLRPGSARRASLNCGSIDETCPRRPCATHTDAEPEGEARRRPLLRALILRRTVRSTARSILVTAAVVARFPTQIDPAPKVIGPGRVPTPGCRPPRDRWPGRRPRPSSLGRPPTPHHPEGGEPRSLPRRARRRSAAAAIVAGRRQNGTTGATGASSASGRSGRNSVGSPSAAAW